MQQVSADTCSGLTADGAQEARGIETGGFIEAQKAPAECFKHCATPRSAAEGPEERPDLHEGPRLPKLGGFVRFSSCDWPGRLAAVVFVSGCPWRCHYCHNPHLQKRNKEAGDPAWSDVLEWLESRRGLLDGLVVCGGEPLAEPRLPEMLAEVKARGFGVALHTGGSYPQRLRDCLPYVDWIGFDVKAPFADYEKVTQIRKSGDPAWQSLMLVKESGIEFECRTTAHHALLPDCDLLAIGKTLAALDIRHYVIQKFRTHGCNAPALLATPSQAPYPAPQTLAALAALFPHFAVRDA